MNLAQFSIDKNRIIFMVLTTIVLMGLVMYSGLSRDSMPPYTVRLATVVSEFPGQALNALSNWLQTKLRKRLKNYLNLKR